MKATPNRQELRDAGMARVVERNIQALLERRKGEEKARAWQERLAEAITRFTGSMLFVYVHVLLYERARLPGPATLRRLGCGTGCRASGIS